MGIHLKSRNLFIIEKQYENIYTTYMNGVLRVNKGKKRTKHFKKEILYIYFIFNKIPSWVSLEFNY